MILIPHLLLGAAIGHLVKYPNLALILAFFSHYFLDFFPHIEYSIKNITDKKWKKSLPQILKVVLDFSAGIILIYIFAGWNIKIFACALCAILPDGFSILMPSRLHQETIHFLKYKKISILWRILSQVLAVIVSLLIIIN